MRDTTLAIVVVGLIVLAAISITPQPDKIMSEIIPHAFTAIGSLATGMALKTKKKE